jgi:3-oxoacyl-[acyl-carrier protein] reductase
MPGILDNKKALVTGGSRGIGRAIVLALAKAGSHVVFTFNNNAAAAKEVEAESKALGGHALGIQSDLTKLEDIQRAFEFIPSTFGGDVDIYVGNAFPTTIFQPTASMGEADYDRMFDAVKGHYFALQQAALHVRPGGRIIVLSSGAARMPQPASGAYAGAKAAIERFALSLAKELGSKQISVNVISPGVTDTDGLVAPQEMVNALVAQTPMGRLGQPEDVANAVLLLTRPESQWISGQIIQANGGSL